MTSIVISVGSVELPDEPLPELLFDEPEFEDPLLPELLFEELPPEIPVHFDE